MRLNKVPSRHRHRQMKKQIAVLLASVLTAALGISACVPRQQNSKANQEFEWSSNSAMAGPTSASVVMILIDGLGLPLFDEMSQQNQLPNLQKFFGPRRYQARSVFPSLTFPNLTSLLTSRPLNLHAIAGNRVAFSEYNILNFESTSDMPKLAELVEQQTIFTKLKNQQRRSWSLSYSFNFGSLKILQPNIGAGLQYVTEDFDKLDAETLRESINAFKKLQAKSWPSFVFIHLIGLDAISHVAGPYSPRAVSYLRQLDRKLGPLLSWLEKNETGSRTITTVLASDHGFAKILRHIDVTEIVKELTPGDRSTPLTLNEMRMAALHFTRQWSATEKLALAKGLSQHTDVQAVFSRIGLQDIYLDTKTAQLKLETVSGQSCPPYDFALKLKDRILCPQLWDNQVKFSDMHAVFENVAAYVKARNSAHTVVLAAPGVGFASRYLGQHGGMTAEEMQTPLLLRNAVVTASSNEIPIYQLLDSFSF